MPIVNGKYVPRRANKIKGPLFAVIPPDDPDEPVPATEDDRKWFDTLLDLTVEALVYQVAEVEKNYRNHKGYKFTGAQLSGFLRRTGRIAAHLGDQRHYVNDQLNRLVKQTGLVKHSTEQGERENWPMATVRLDKRTARVIVAKALRGKFDKIV